MSVECFVSCVDRSLSVVVCGVCGVVWCVVCVLLCVCVVWCVVCCVLCVVF